MFLTAHFLIDTCSFSIVRRSFPRNFGVESCSFRRRFFSARVSLSLAHEREISREMYHARLSGVPNDVARNHCGQSGTEHFMCISSADETDYAVTVKFRVHELRRWNRFRQREGDDSPYQTY